MSGGEGRDGSGEFHRIERYFAPLSKAAPGAFNLTDDAARVDMPDGRELVVSVDTLVGGVHFIGDEAPDQLARKAMRVNLSDLAGMGARPLGYFLSLSLPKATDEAWVAAFCEGLSADQDAFDWGLLGGDSTSTPGPITLSLTAMGTVAPGQALRRSGARPGDGIFVSGTIGDGVLGLLAARGKLPYGPEADWLEARYRLPDPRVALGQALAGVAHGAMDISDGLVADLGHLCRASGCGAEITCQDIPLSDAAAEIVAGDPSLFPDLLTGGDDYELLIVGPGDAIRQAGKASGTKVTRIGTVTEATPVRFLDADGVAMRFEHGGFRHF